MRSVLVTLALLVIGHFPLLYSYFVLLWELDHYQFFPFAIVALGWLIYERHDRRRFHWSWFSSLLVLLDLILVGAGIALPSPWPVMAGLLCSFVAVTLALRDKETGRSLLYLAPIAMLLLRIPLGFDLRLIAWMQSVTTQVASVVLHRFKYLHFRAGNVLELSDKTLLVEEACSGIQSLFTVLFLAAVIVVWNRRMFVHTVLLLLSAVFWAAVFNVLRVVGIAVAWRQYNLDLTLEWQHSAWGYVVLLASILFLICTDVFLASLTSPVPDEIPNGSFRNPLAMMWNHFFQHRLPRHPNAPVPQNKLAPPFVRSPVVAFVLASGLVWAQTQFGMAASNFGGLAQSRPDILMEDDLPEQFNGWTRGEYKLEMRRAGNAFGEYSNQWSYAKDNQQCMISCDHAFRGWHNLETCYAARGWIVESRKIIEMQDPDWPAVSVAFSRQTGERAMLFYSLFDGYGNGAVPPGESTSAALVDRIFRKSSIGSGGIDPLLYQSQVFLETEGELSDDRLKELTTQHEVARAQMRKKYLERHGG